MNEQLQSRRREVQSWRLRTRRLELGRSTLVMGVVNITPDSFSDGGAFLEPEAAVAHALRMLDDGADLVDLGAESTRPGSNAGWGSPAVSADEEMARLLPVLEGIVRAGSNAIVSVDTYKAATARAALTAGAEIINDVSGLTWDAHMPDVCARAGCGVVLMHSRGRPDEWKSQEQLPSHGLLSMVRDGLRASLDTATSAGVARDAIVLDPGYGFGKKLDENFSLLARQGELLDLGRPLLAGLSRKSFLGHALASLHDGRSASVRERETASLAALVLAIANGASIVRVHDVKPAVEAVHIADAMLEAG